MAWEFEYVEAGWATRLAGVVVFPSSARGPIPGVVVSHGSGGTGAAIGMAKATSWFAPRGYAVIAPNYTHVDDACRASRDCAGSPENVRRAGTALRILASDVLRQATGTAMDTARLYLYGNSMGAGVSVEAAAQLGCAVAASALTAGGLGQELTPTGAGGLATVTSPMLLLHGTQDTTVRPAQAQSLSDALASQGKVRQLVWFPGVGHGLHSEPGTASVAGEFVHQWFLTYGGSAAPELRSVTPSAAVPGTLLVVTGQRLGENVGGLSQLLLGTTPAGVASWRPDRIEATVPAGAGASVTALVPVGPVTDPSVGRPVEGGATSNALRLDASALFQ